MQTQITTLTAPQISFFHHNGYLVLSKAVDDKQLKDIRQSAQYALKNPQPPWELESQLGYPGAPDSSEQLGGSTTRRLLGAYQRNILWRNWATNPQQAKRLRQLFNNDEIFLSQSHHNCLMTKSPQFSSDTGWHQDIRYWSFNTPKLITAWLPLNNEYAENGALSVIPESHRMSLSPQQFDEKLFFIPSEQNKELISKELTLELEAGDILLFHSHLLHRACRNYTDVTKMSLVFTYYCSDSSPIKGSRSASMPSVRLD